MSEMKRPVFAVLAPAIALALMATAGSAQQPTPSTAPASPPPAMAQCTAKATPTEVAAGEKAVKLTFALSSPIGEVSGIEAPEGSGIALAPAADIPREPLANPTAAPKPIELATETNTLTVWIATTGAKAGAVDVKLQGLTGTCTTSLTVK